MATRVSLVCLEFQELPELMEMMDQRGKKETLVKRFYFFMLKFKTVFNTMDKLLAINLKEVIIYQAFKILKEIYSNIYIVSLCLNILL